MRQQNYLYYKHVTLTVLFLWGLRHGEVAKSCDLLCKLTFQEKYTFYLGTFLIFSRNSFSKRTPHTPVQYTHTYFFVTGHLLFNHF